MAAQNCRKRKIDQIKQLETEVTHNIISIDSSPSYCSELIINSVKVRGIKCRKTELVTDHEKLMAQRSTWADLVKRLHDYVLKVLVFVFVFVLVFVRGSLTVSSRYLYLYLCLYLYL